MRETAKGRETPGETLWRAESDPIVGSRGPSPRLLIGNPFVSIPMNQWRICPPGPLSIRRKCFTWNEPEIPSVASTTFSSLIAKPPDFHV